MESVIDLVICFPRVMSLRHYYYWYYYYYYYYIIIIIIIIIIIKGSKSRGGHITPNFFFLHQRVYEREKKMFGVISPPPDLLPLISSD